MKTFRADWLEPCRTCGTRHDEVSNPADTGGPVAGAISICIVCHEMSIIEDLGPLGHGYRLRELTDEELQRAALSPRVQALRAALMATRRNIGPPPSTA